MLKVRIQKMPRLLGPLLAAAVCLPLAGCMTAEDPWGEGSMAYTVDQMYPIAARKPCGKAVPDLGTDYSNHFAPNHGCAVHHNIAALVADPTVLRKPKKRTLIPGDTAVLAINAMNTNATQSTATSNGAGSISSSTSP